MTLYCWDCETIFNRKKNWFLRVKETFYVSRIQCYFFKVFYYLEWLFLERIYSKRCFTTALYISYFFFLLLYFSIYHCISKRDLVTNSIWMRECEMFYGDVLALDAYNQDWNSRFSHRDLQKKLWNMAKKERKTRCFTISFLECFIAPLPHYWSLYLRSGDYKKRSFL